MQLGAESSRKQAEVRVRAELCVRLLIGTELAYDCWPPGIALELGPDDLVLGKGFLHNRGKGVE